MPDADRQAGAVTLLLLLIVALAGCGPSRAEIQEREDQARYHYDLAYGYFFDAQNQQGEQALVEIARSLELNEKNPDANLLAGLVFQGHGRYLDAVRHYQRALELNPELYYARNNLGTAFLALERWDDAIATLTPLSLEIRYDQKGHVQNNLGWAFFKKGDSLKARDHFYKAISQAPKLCPAFNNLGILLIEADELPKAEKILRQGLQICPTNYAEPWFHLGRVQLRQGDPKGAEQSFKQCLKFGGMSSLADRCEQQLRPLAVGEAR
jgi:type IV pilus assembly protein PilF